MFFFLFHWLRPYGDRATIKLLNSWRQGWNWTELPVTWLPLPNDNLGFNQKKPLSAWLIQKLRWRTPRSARGRLFLFTSLSAQFILLSTFQSSPLSYKMCFLRMADALYYKEGAQPRVRGFVHSSFSYCLRMSVENAPTTNTHTRRHTQRHTFHASSYSHRQESDFRGERKHTLKTDIETSRQTQTPTIQSVQWVETSEWMWFFKDA